MTFVRFDHADSGALHDATVARISGALGDAIAARGSAVLAVSGGKSPVPMFEALSEIGLPWDKVTVTLVDERFLPTDNPDSNEHLVRSHLLRHAAAATPFVGMRGTAATPDEAADAADAAVAALTQPFDVVVLGMGGDGHTASWFPKGDRLDQAIDPSGKRRVISMIADDGAATAKRMTLTLPVVAGARLVLLPLEGEGKLATLAKAVQDGPVREMPIRAAFRHATVEIHTSG